MFLATAFDGNSLVAPNMPRWRLVLMPSVLLNLWATACTVERRPIGDDDPAHPAPAGGVVVGGEGGRGGSGSGSAGRGGGGTSGAGGAMGMGGEGGQGARSFDGGGSVPDARPTGPGSAADATTSTPSPDASLAPPPDAAAPPPAMDTAPPAPPDQARAPDAAAPPADPPCPQAATLALCLTFEAALADESMYRHTLQVQGGATLTSDGSGGRVLSVAPGAVVRAGESSAFDTAAFTIEAWVNPRALPAAAQRMGIIDNDGQFGFFIQPGGGLSCTAGNTEVVTAGGLIRANAWSSIACTMTGQEMTVWVDGRSVGRAAAAGPVSTAGTNGITVGSNNPNGMNLDGLMDNVRLWRQARSQSQLCAAARTCAR